MLHFKHKLTPFVKDNQVIVHVWFSHLIVFENDDHIVFSIDKKLCNFDDGHISNISYKP